MRTLRTLVVLACLGAAASVANAGEFSVFLAKLQLLDKNPVTDPRNPLDDEGAHVSFEVKPAAHARGSGTYLAQAGDVSDNLDIYYPLIRDADAGCNVQFSLIGEHIPEEGRPDQEGKRLCTLRIKLDKAGNLAVEKISGDVEIVREGKFQVVRVLSRQGKREGFKLWFRRFRD